MTIDPAPSAAETAAYTPEQMRGFAARLATDFGFFMRALFADRGRISREYTLGDIEMDMCDWAANGPRQRGLLAFRFSGKTTLVTCGYTCWRLFRDPDTKVLIVSKSVDHAKKALSLTREWVRNVSFLQHLDPTGDRLKTDSTFQFDVAGIESDSLNPSVLAKGIEGQITGTHAHVVIGDDVETPENCKTVAARLELRAKVREFKSIATFGGRDIIYVGTIHHPIESLYPHLAKMGYAFRTWPLTYPVPGEKFLGLAPIVEQRLADGSGKPGEPTCPYRIDPEYLADQRKEGELNWKLQCQCATNTGSTHRHPIKISDLIVFPVQRDKAPLSIAWGTSNDRGGSTAVDIPIAGLDGNMLYGPIMFDTQWAAYTGTKAWVDPAGKGRDKTGFAAIGHLAAMLWVKSVLGLPGGASSERLSEIAHLLRGHGVRDCYVETNIDAFDTYFPNLEVEVRKLYLEPGQDPAYPEGWKCTLTRRHSTGQKELRVINALEPVISTHRMVMHPGALTPHPEQSLHDELQWQLAAITQERNSLREDGKIDALAGCTKEWMDVLRLDPVRASASARQRSIEDKLAEHRRQIAESRGYQPRQPRWFHH